MIASCFFRPFAMLAVCVAVLLPDSLRAQATGGVIEGRVFNAATGNALVNVRVVLEGAGREVITDEAGSYRIANVPVGEARLSVSYVGMAPQKATVSVPASGTARREFELVLERTARATAAGELVKRTAWLKPVDSSTRTAAAMSAPRRACCRPSGPAAAAAAGSGSGTAA